MARRGPIREMRSDNGANFVGALNELLQAIEEMDRREIRTKLIKENIDWIVTKGYHQRENTGSRLFTEVKPRWTGL